MSDRLFIIGNGFDLAHGLKTSYNDFKNYLITEYDVCPRCEDFLQLPKVINLRDGGIDFNGNDAANFFIQLIENIIGSNWAEFEETLGELNFSDLFQEELNVYDDDNFINPWKTEINYEVFGYELFELMQNLKLFFEERIKKIHIDKSLEKTEIKKLLKEKNAIFLNFNYTHTLEKIYDIKNVLHIHGDVELEIYVGHGKEILESDDIYVNNCSYVGAQNSILTSFKKPVKKIIKKNKPFFTTEIKNLKEIYVFGFSFSNVDIDYFKEIFKNTNSKKIIIYLNKYDSTKFKDYKTKLINAGFLGKFDIY